jgi:acyl carrier protein
VHGAPGANKKKPTAAEMAKYLQVKCAEISGYPETTMSVDNGFLSLGLDSLVAMTLANHLRRDFGCTVPLTQILMSQSLNSLADAICRSIPG